MILMLSTLQIYRYEYFKYFNFITNLNKCFLFIHSTNKYCFSKKKEFMMKAMSLKKLKH